MEIETVGDNNQSESENESGGDYLSDDSEDPNDPHYKKMSGSEEFEEDSLVPNDECVSDEEQKNIKQNTKKFKDSMYNVMNIPNKSFS